jgi:hypothetical protein
MFYYGKYKMQNRWNDKMNYYWIPRYPYRFHYYHFVIFASLLVLETPNAKLIIFWYFQSETDIIWKSQMLARQFWRTDRAAQSHPFITMSGTASHYHEKMPCALLYPSLHPKTNTCLIFLKQWKSFTYSRILYES